MSGSPGIMAQVPGITGIMAQVPGITGIMAQVPGITDDENPNQYLIFPGRKTFGRSRMQQIHLCQANISIHLTPGHLYQAYISNS